MYPLAGSSRLLVVRERRLVAVMPVCDQEPPVGKGRTELLVGQPPEPRALDLEVGRAIGHLERGQRPRRAGRSARAGRASHGAGGAGPPSARDAFARAAGPCRPRRARPQRADEPGASPGDAVRADVVLGERPEARLLGNEDPFLAPARESFGPPPPPIRGASDGRRCGGSRRASARAAPGRSRRTAARRALSSGPARSVS